MTSLSSVLLISTDRRYRNFAIRFLTSFLLENGIDAQMLFLSQTDLEAGPGYQSAVESVARWIVECDFEWVGLCLMTGGVSLCSDLYKTIAAHPNRPKLVVGGIHARVRPQEAADISGVDAVVLGPGEKALLELVRGVPQDRIPETKHDDRSWRYVHFDSLPYPCYDFSRSWVFCNDKVTKFNRRHYEKSQPWDGRFYYLTTALGCPYRCGYCSSPELKIRGASVERAIAELEHMLSNWSYLAGVDVQDESFFLHDDEWVRSFAYAYAERIRLPLIIRLMPRFVTADRLAPLKEAGLCLVKMGLQGSERLNRNLYARPENRASFVHAMEVLDNLDIGAEIDVILDNPWESEVDLADTAETLNLCPKPFWVHAYGLTLYPGTRIEEFAREQDMEKQFATDPYCSELFATGEKGYRTPIAWRRLIQDVCGWAPHREIEQLLSARGDKFETAVMQLWNFRPYKRKEQLIKKFINLRQRD